MPPTNGFFKLNDRKVDELAGTQIPREWWSRGYEYAFAIDNALMGHAAADMGCGWMPRPLTPWLAKFYDKVYAVDADNRLLEQDKAANVVHVIADMTEEIRYIKANSVNDLYCISVLEDLQKPDKIAAALKEFRRILKPGGCAIITFDVQYDINKPCPVYPGIADASKFLELAAAAGLSPVTEVSYDKRGAVVNDEWNLCVFHCVLT